MKTFIDHDFAKLKRITTANGRLYETPDGRAYPSVTTITGQHSKQGIMEWRKKVGEEEATRISTRAANRGTRIHYLCEDYLRGIPTNPAIFDADIFKSITPHLNDINNIHALESPLYSHHLEVAGTVDCVAEYKGKLAVIDFKTSSKIKDREWIHSYFMQTAAYSVMFEDRFLLRAPLDKYQNCCRIARSRFECKDCKTAVRFRPAPPKTLLRIRRPDIPDGFSIP